MFSVGLRDRIFQAGMHDWAYGWFVTRIPAGEPGAGQTRAEMRGDMPGNFFSWILRYPERDAVIVLRNGYGSTERLEENLQAILFEAEPRLSMRSPKDLLARAWQVPMAWVRLHVAISAMLVLAGLTAVWQAVRRRRRPTSHLGVG